MELLIQTMTVLTSSAPQQMTATDVLILMVMDGQTPIRAGALKTEQMPSRVK